MRPFSSFPDSFPTGKAPPDSRVDGVCFEKSRFIKYERFEKVDRRVGLGVKRFPNRAEEIDAAPLKKLLPRAVEKALAWISEEREAFEKRMGAKPRDKLDALDRLQSGRRARLDNEVASRRRFQVVKLDSRAKPYETGFTRSGSKMTAFASPGALRWVDGW